MADRFFQGYVYQLQGSIPRTFGVLHNGEIVSCSNQELIGQCKPPAQSDRRHAGEDCFVIKNDTYRVFYKNSFVTYMVFVEGVDSAAEDYATILAVCFTGMKSYFEEKYNRSLFYKNLFLENYLPEDIGVRASMLRIAVMKARAVFLLRFPRIDGGWDLSSLTKRMEKPEKYELVAMTETDAIVIAETGTNISHRDLEALGTVFQQAAFELFGCRPIVGIGSVVIDIRQLADSYRESLYVLALIYLFEGKRTVIDYNHLGINRLIYQLPLPLCEKYLNEVFLRGGFESLETETMDTVDCFFKNNLNVSETARQLFIHRNTLMYRLEKVKKLTGLDLRVFDHAIIFKLAVVIHRHLKYKE